MSIVNKISADLIVKPEWLKRVIARAPYAYKVYEINKKNGGNREISQPARETKLLQYWVIENILSSFPIHDSAMAYAEGRSIKLNAQSHVKNQYIAKLDFSNFFPSFTEKDVSCFFVENSSLEAGEIDILCNILLRKIRNDDSLRMTIGAPSSPMLSNIMMYQFDQHIKQIADEVDITYTRYADDLVFSSNEKGCMFHLPELIEEYSSTYKYGKLSLNNDKTIFRSKKNNRRVTGITLTNDNRLSVGRENKRLIRSMVHHYILGNMPADEWPKLHGYLSFIRDVEPNFYTKLLGKYGSDWIVRLKRDVNSLYEAE